MMIKKILSKLRYSKNHQIENLPKDMFPVEATASDKRIRDLVMPFTMTSQERLWSLLSAIKYIVSSRIRGAFVECGVWRGGSAMTMAYQLMELGDLGRSIWLYDTFQGMTEPTDVDVEAGSGNSAAALLSKTEKVGANNIWCIASKEDVVLNLSKTGYPDKMLKLVQGDVLETLDTVMPEEIALLRLDTDWYESTKKELEVLFPKLVSGGICIIDDYGYWSGARKAVDEYLAKNDLVVLMHRIDETGRIFIKN